MICTWRSHFVQTVVRSGFLFRLLLLLLTVSTFSHFFSVIQIIFHVSVKLWVIHSTVNVRQQSVYTTASRQGTGFVPCKHAGRKYVIGSAWLLPTCDSTGGNARDKHSHWTATRFSRRKLLIRNCRLIIIVHYYIKWWCNWIHELCNFLNIFFIASHHSFFFF